MIWDQETVFEPNFPPDRRVSKVYTNEELLAIWDAYASTRPHGGLIAPEVEELFQWAENRNPKWEFVQLLIEGFVSITEFSGGTPLVRLQSTIVQQLEETFERGRIRGRSSFNTDKHGARTGGAGANEPVGQPLLLVGDRGPCACARGNATEERSPSRNSKS